MLSEGTPEGEAKRTNFKHAEFPAAGLQETSVIVYLRNWHLPSLSRRSLRPTIAVTVCVVVLFLFGIGILSCVSL